MLNYLKNSIYLRMSALTRKPRDIEAKVGDQG